MPHLIHNNPSSLRVGFVPLVDCAPLVLAAECGFFEAAGLKVRLMREHGWATIRDKVVYGELEAAHSLVGLCFAISWGLGVVPRDCVSGFLFNSHGDAVTVSRGRLGDGGRRDGTLAAAIMARRGERQCAFGVPHLFSSHHFLLRQWLRSAGITPGRDALIVVIPPSQMVPMMEGGHIDGFCVGEPYNTIAVSRGSGVEVATSAELSLMHPEKALLVTRAFAESRTDEHLAMVSALIAAGAWCDTREGREEACRILSRRAYLGIEESILRESLLHRDDDFHIFSRHEVNRPSSEKAAWVLTRIRETGLLDSTDPRLLQKVPDIFREDIYEQSLAIPTRQRTPVGGTRSGARPPGQVILSPSRKKSLKTKPKSKTKS